MKWFLKLFKPRPRPKPALTVEHYPLTVEHYPLTGRYYPKVGDYYLQRDSNTGIYSLKEPQYFVYADSVRSENDAWRMLDTYMEQHYKVNVTILTRKP